MAGCIHHAIPIPSKPETRPRASKRWRQKGLNMGHSLLFSITRIGTTVRDPNPIGLRTATLCGNNEQKPLTRVILVAPAIILSVDAGVARQLLCGGRNHQLGPQGKPCSFVRGVHSPRESVRSRGVAPAGRSGGAVGFPAPSLGRVAYGIGVTSHGRSHPHGHRSAGLVWQIQPARLPRA